MKVMLYIILYKYLNINKTFTRLAYSCLKLDYTGWTTFGSLLELSLLELSLSIQRISIWPKIAHTRHVKHAAITQFLIISPTLSPILFFNF